ncbi:hypothetical protein ABZ471_41930 [Streptomyces sp. NPDC005728]|uniref:hypothetical protein n=1 Tax=Streptomyces sp. NPDC005728 TaxID=3157054 RepID=UPI003402C1E4
MSQIPSSDAPESRIKRNSPGSPPGTEWAHPGAWHLVLADVQALALPIPARGQVVRWRPSPDLVAQVFQQLPDFRP